MIVHRIPRDKNDINIGTIYDTKYGCVCIMNREGRTSRNILLYRVRFIDTGYETVTQLSNVKNNNVHDYRYKSKAHGGYLGDKAPAYLSNDRDLYLSLKIRWTGMLQRCNNPVSARYEGYGGSGIKVCDRWLCFTNYYDDVIQIKGFDRDAVLAGKLELDKDYLQSDIDKSERVYSKDTCIWLNTKENCVLRGLEKKLIVTDANGNSEIVGSVQECMRKYHFDTRSLYHVLHGDRYLVNGCHVEYAN